MELFYRLAADFVLFLHFSYVAFVVVGFLLILLGACLRWQWIRNFWFRAIHLACILIVAGQALLGLICPLTIWENRLRALAGQATYEGAFVATWVEQLLYYDFPGWVFTLAYTLFGLLVIAALLFAPPRPPAVWKKWRITRVPLGRRGVHG